MNPFDHIKRLVSPRYRAAVRRWLDAASPDLRAARDRAAGRSHFFVESLRLAPDRVELAAWVAGPADALRDVRPTWNGNPFDAVERHPRPDVLAAVPFLAGRRGVAAIGVRATAAARLGAGDWVEVGIAGPLGRPVRDYLPDPAEPWPDDVRRQRVHGAADPDAFRRVGATAFVGLRDGLRAATGQDVTDFPRVLDWGCGCGRVTRHLGRLPVAVTGVDVDADNVGWCRANFAFGSWHAIPLHPPTQLPAESFDLAIGVSIFTHLKEAEQFEWLAELRRLVRPGGVLLMTTHGEEAAAAVRLPGRAVRELFARGICDVPNRQYDADLREADYYRNTLHTSEYLRREWGRYFDVVAILPEQVDTQNLVVLRRR